MSDTTSAVHLQYQLLSIPFSVVFVLLSQPLSTRAASLIHNSFPVTSTPSTLASNVAASSMAEVIATRHSLHIHRNKNHYIIHLLIAVVDFHGFSQFSQTYHIYVHALSITAVLTAFRFAFLASQHPASTKCNKGLARLRRQMRANKLAPKHMQL